MPQEFSDHRPILHARVDLPYQTQTAPAGPGPETPPSQRGGTTRTEGVRIEGELEFLVRRRGRMAKLVLENGLRVGVRDGRFETTWVAAEGLVKVTVRASGGGGPAAFNLSTEDLVGVDIEVAWQVLHFLAMSRTGSEFSLGIPGGSRTWNRFPSVDAVIEPVTERLALQVRELGRYAGRPLVMPGEFDAELRTGLKNASTLIAGGIVEGRWSDAEVTFDQSDAVAMNAGDNFMIELQSPYEVHLPGEDPLWVERWARLRHARVVEREASGDGVRVLLRPGSTDLVEYRRSSWPQYDVSDRSRAVIEVGTWVATFDDKILATASDLRTLAATVERIGLRPDAVFRAGSSDLPGAM